MTREQAIRVIKFALVQARSAPSTRDRDAFDDVMIEAFEVLGVTRKEYREAL